MIVQVIDELTRRTMREQLVWTSKYHYDELWSGPTFFADCGDEVLHLTIGARNQIKLSYQETTLVDTHSTDTPEAIAVRELHSACLAQIDKQNERDKAVAAEHLASILGIGVD